VAAEKATDDDIAAEELVHQTWEEEKIKRERFCYDPLQMQG
jgi:hypothetical protein